MARTFQNVELFANLTVLDNLMLGRHTPPAVRHARRDRLAGPGPAAGARRPGRGRGDRRLPRAGAVAPAAGRPAAVRRAEAGRARPGAGHGAEAAAARRAGGGHEPRGDRGHGPLHPRHPRRARHPDHPRRARHGPGHGPGRPGAWWSTSASRSPPARPPRSSTTPTSSGPTWGRCSGMTATETTGHRWRRDRRDHRHPGPRPGATTPQRGRHAGEGLRHLAGGHLGRLLGHASQTVGHALLALGIEPGDRVAIHSENRREWLYADVGDRRGPGDHRRPLPDQPAGRGRLPAVALRRAGAHRRGPGAGRQGARGARPLPRPGADRLPRAARHPAPLRRTRSCCRGRTSCALGAEHRRGQPGRGGRADGRGRRRTTSRR